MNKNMLYVSDEDGDNKVCKLCGRACGDHFKECPGEVIEGLLYFVRVTDPWDVVLREGDAENGTSAYTPEEALAYAASENTYHAEAKAHIFYVSPGEECTARYLVASRAKHEERKAKEAARVLGIRRRERENAFAALKALESDFTPVAFQRRWAELMAKYADVEEK